MSLKLALIVAVVCVAQVFADEPAATQVQCVDESVLEIKYDVEQALQEMNEIRETFTIATVDSYVRGTDIRVILACYREQRPNYIQLGKRLSALVKKASNDLRKDLGEDYEKFAEGVRALRNIAVIIRTVPREVMALIQNKKFAEAMKLMRESRKVIEDNVRVFIEVSIELRESFPETVKKFVLYAREIRTVAKEGNDAISKAFQKCIENGGPNKPLGNDSDDSDDSDDDDDEDDD